LQRTLIEVVSRSLLPFLRPSRAFFPHFPLSPAFPGAVPVIRRANWHVSKYGKKSEASEYCCARVGEIRLLRRSDGKKKRRRKGREEYGVHCLCIFLTHPLRDASCSARGSQRCYDFTRAEGNVAPEDASDERQRE